MSNSDQKQAPLLRFGVIADVQYADADDAIMSYDTSKRRYYRSSLDQLRLALKHWDQEQPRPSFILQLGDLIDGVNRNLYPKEKIKILNDTLKVFESISDMPTFHCIGKLK